MDSSIQHFPQSNEEFGCFVDQHLDRFVRHAVSCLGNIHDAEDIVQEVILKAFRNRLELSAVSKPQNYIHRMISNSCLDHLRRNGCREAYIRRSLNDKEEEHAEPYEALLIRREENLEVQMMLDRLPPEQAEVIRLRFAAELSFGDIAEIMSAPLTTVKSRFSYGMNKLRSGFLSKKEVYDEL